MSRTKIIILILLTLILLAGVGVTVYLALQSQDIRSRAQTNEGGSTCTPPAAVSGVRVGYPNCESGRDPQCVYAEANCTWNASSGIASYRVTVTEVETSKNIKTETLGSTTTKLVFQISSGNTYRCDVSAINSCGAESQVATDSKLCSVQLVPSPSPSPVVSPSPVPTPTPSPTPPPPAPSPRPVVLDCGYTPCNVNATCKAGLTCIQARDGNHYCSMPEFQASCANNPTVNTCCVAPKPVTVLPPSGDINATNVVIGVGMALILFAGAALFKGF